MARVYLAHDIRHARDVAIKVLRRDVSVELGAERFLREVTTTAALHHPNILPLFDSGQVTIEVDRPTGSRETTLLYYVMPYIEGETLRQRLDREKQLAVDEAIRITGEVADALDYAHEQGIIHRDVKPENILLDRGRAMVADFGVARAISMADSDKITRSGVTVGTPTYMSPEQASSQVELDGRSDLYALACVLHEMLGGQPPFTGATAAIVVRQHLTVEPPSITNVRSGVPTTVVAALHRALAKAPSDRFPRVRDFAAALRTEQSTVPTATAAAAPAPTGRPWRWSLLVVAVFAALFLAWWFLLRGDGGGTITPDLSSVAVLPFDDLSPDHASGYLGDGIAETLINALVAVPGLTVSGRTSSFSLRDRTDDLAEISRRLGVATVLQGSVQRAGERLRITAKLLTTADGALLWSHRFDGDAAQIFAMQDSVASAVVLALQGRVLARTDAGTIGHGTANPAAYDAYLLGRHFWGKRTTDDMVRAAKHFNEAIAADSTYALAWSGLADAYVLFIPAEYDVPGVKPDSMLDLAEAAARRAVALDPTLGEAWSSLGEVLEYRDKWTEARTAFEKGVQLSPKYPTAHQWYAYDLMNWNEWDNSIREMSRARDLDPLSLVIVVSLGMAYDGAERWDDAEAAYEQAAAIAPDHPLLIQFRFWHDLLRGATDRWPDAFARVARLEGQDSTTTAALQAALARPTSRDSALRQVALRSGPYIELAVTRVLDGDEAAIALVEALHDSPDRAKVNGAGLMTLLSPALRADPRMQDALVRLGYPRP